MRFLRDNWIWIALPLLVAAGVLAFLLLSEAPDETDPFQYPIVG